MIGEVSDTIVINSVQFEYAQIYNAYTKTLNGIYPLYHNADKGNCENITVPCKKKIYYPQYVKDVTVVIPVFPGTNCEYDSAKAFMKRVPVSELIVFDRKRQERKTSNKDWQSSTDEDARIAKLKDGRTHTKYNHSGT